PGTRHGFGCGRAHFHAPFTPSSRPVGRLPFEMSSPRPTSPEPNRVVTPGAALLPAEQAARAAVRVRLRVLGGLSGKEVGRRLGVTGDRADRLWRAALGRLRTAPGLADERSG